MLRTYVVGSRPILAAVTTSTLLNHWSGSSPRVGAAVQRRIATLYQQGHTMHQMSKQLSMGYGTAWNDAQRVKKDNLLYI